MYKLPSSLSIIYLPNFFGGHGGEGTPEPIPNSEVKLSIADDTASLLWESRPPPKILQKAPCCLCAGSFFAFAGDVVCKEAGSDRSKNLRCLPFLFTYLKIYQHLPRRAEVGCQKWTQYVILPYRRGTYDRTDTVH